MADNPIKHEQIIEQGNPFDDAIKGLKLLQSELKKTAKIQLDFAKKQDANSKQGQENLKKAATATKQLTAAQKQALTIQNQLEKEKAKLLQLDSKEYKELIRTREAIKAKNAELRKSVKAQQDGAKSTNTWAKAMGSFAAKFNTIGNIAANVASTITRKLVTSIKGAIKIVIDFEKAMADVRAITGANNDEFEKLSKSARDLGGSTKFTASQVAGLQKEYAKLGFTTSEILNAQEATLALAAATGSDLARAAEVAGNTLRAFGLNARSTQRVTDVMAKSFTSSALDMERFAESMKFVAPIAKTANVSIEETTALLAILADSGISGSMAGTSLRKVFGELVGTGGELSERLRDLSEKGLTLADAEDEVGERARTALLVLTDQIDKLPKLQTAFEGAAGAAQEMADIQLDTLSGKLAILKSAYQEFTLEVSDNEDAMNGAKNVLDTAAKTLQVTSEALEKNEGRWAKISGRIIRFVPILGEVTRTFDKFSFFVDIASKSNEEFAESIEGGGINIKQALKDMWTGLKDGFSAALGLNKEIADLTETTKDYSDLLRELRNERVIDEDDIDMLDFYSEKLNAIGAKGVEDLIKKLDIERNIRTTALNQDISAKDAARAAEKAKDEEDADFRKGLLDSGLAAAQQTSDAIFSYQQRLLDAKYAAEIEGADGNKDAIEKIRKEQAEEEQELAVKKALIDGALAIVKTYAQFGFTPQGIIAALAQATATGIQVAAIKSVQFGEGGSGLLGDKGGVLQGASHGGGGIDLGEIGEGEGGEYFGIINKNMTRKYSDDLPTIFDSINKGKFHDVWSRANIILNQDNVFSDPYTKMMYQIMLTQGTPYTDSDGNQVIQFPHKKRIITKNV